MNPIFASEKSVGEMGFPFVFVQLQRLKIHLDSLIL